MDEPDEKKRNQRQGRKSILRAQNEEKSKAYFNISRLTAGMTERDDTRLLY